MAKKTIWNKNFVMGLILIGVAILIYTFRPYQNCSIWSGIPILSGLACSGMALAIALPLLIICSILLIVGIVLLIKGALKN